MKRTVFFQPVRKPPEKLTHMKYEIPVGSDEFCVGNRAGTKQPTGFGILIDKVGLSQFKPP
jgi:hypothetical protein